MTDGWASPSGGPSDPAHEPAPERPAPRWGQYAPTPDQTGYGVPGVTPPGAAPGTPPTSPPAAPPAQSGYRPPMAHKPGVIPLRPLTMSDVFEGSFATIRGNPAATIGMALLVGVACLIPSALLTWGISQIPTESATGADVTWQLANLGSEVIMAIGGIVLTGILTAVLGEAILGRRMSPAEAWAAARPRIGGLLLLTLTVFAGAVGLVAVGVVVMLILVAVGSVAGAVIGGVLLLVTGLLVIYLWIRFALAAPALVLERIGPIQALRRSWRLTAGQFWRLFGITLLATIAAGLVAAIVIAPASLLLVGSALSASSPSDPAALGLGSLFLLMCISVLVDALVRPFLAEVTGLLYIDQRIRREALDVTLMHTVSATAPPR